MNLFQRLDESELLGLKFVSSDWMLRTITAARFARSDMEVASKGGCLLAGQAPWVKKKLETVGSDKLIDANRCAKVNITKVIKVQFTIYGNFG